jgi:hypothetical protein
MVLIQVMATRLELLAFDRAARGGGQDTPATTPQVSTYSTLQFTLIRILK